MSTEGTIFSSYELHFHLINFNSAKYISQMKVFHQFGVFTSRILTRLRRILGWVLGWSANKP